MAFLALMSCSRRSAASWRMRCIMAASGAFQLPPEALAIQATAWAKSSRVGRTALCRHGPHAYPGMGGQDSLPFFNQRSPGFGIARLGGRGHAIGMASSAGCFINFFTHGVCGIGVGQGHGTGQQPCAKGGKQNGFFHNGAWWLWHQQCQDGKKREQPSICADALYP